MSLGYNTMRQPRRTQLPGTVGASVVRSPFTANGYTTRQQAQSGTPTVSTISSFLAKEKQKETLATNVTTTACSIAKKIENEFDPTINVYHSVFATVKTCLKEVDTNKNLAVNGERVLMVYPMRSNESDGTIHMRLKTVHPCSGQLMYNWAIVYNPINQDRSLIEFSLTP